MAQSNTAGGTTGMAQTTDPVCGMTIDKASAAGTSAYQGQTYYFCATGCKTKFDADPGRYAQRGGGMHA